MAILARRMIKTLVFIVILFITGRLSAPYYYDVISIDAANNLSNFINGNVYAEEVDDVYFYVNFSITLLLSLLLYLLLSKVVIYIFRLVRNNI